MPFSLTPDRMFDCYAQITPTFLRQQGITLLLSDLDFTLAAKKTRRPDQPLRDWIAALKAEGITFMIVSNNRSGQRVTEFCADLGVDYQGHAGKPRRCSMPFRRRLRRAAAGEWKKRPEKYLQ